MQALLPWRRMLGKEMRKERAEELRLLRDFSICDFSHHRPGIRHQDDQNACHRGYATLNTEASCAPFHGEPIASKKIRHALATFDVDVAFPKGMDDIHIDHACEHSASCFRSGCKNLRYSLMMPWRVHSKASSLLL